MGGFTVELVRILSTRLAGIRSWLRMLIHGWNLTTPELTPWQTVVEFGLLEAGILPYNGFSLEHIEGTKIGGSIFDIWGIRHTSADLLRAANPKNFVVLLNATVKNIIFHCNGEKKVR